MDTVSKGKDALIRLVVLDKEEEGIHHIRESVKSPERAVLSVVKEEIVEDLVREASNEVLCILIIELQVKVSSIN